MGSYNLSVASSARKELRRLPKQDIARIHLKMAELATHPRPMGCEKLAGDEDVYRIRQGDYRIVYHVDDAARQITVLRIRHRKDVYR